MIEPSLEQDLALAMHLAEVAADVALPAFHRGVTKKKKADGSVVTETDLAVERELISMLSRERPRDAVLSEESGASGTAQRRWILDPIDGTWWFANGLESWGTHIALEVDGEIVLGVITRPLARQCYWALRGGGAYQDELGAPAKSTRLQVRHPPPREQARVMIWAERETSLCRRLKAEQRWLEPTLDAVLDLASGKLDLLIDYVSSAWDIAPGVVLVREAGGQFADHEGGGRIDAGGRFSNGVSLDP